MFLSSPVATLQMIPDGIPGIMETLKIMSRIVKDYKKSLPVRTLAVSLTSICNQKDWACEVSTLHAFVRDQIRYINDITDVETVHTPDVILSQRAGDCDDKSLLLASLLESIGHPTRFVAIGFQPGVFSHVYVETKIGNNWIPLETTEDVEAGWQPDPKLVLEKRYYHN